MIAKIKAYRSSEDIETSKRYVAEHRKILESYGVKQITSAQIDWLYDPNTFVIIVTTEDEERILGGGRIQVRSIEMKMPMEDAIAKIDKNIYNYVDTNFQYQVAEFCGLFNSKEVAGFGIGSIILGRIGVAVATQVSIKYLMALCSPATLRNCTRVGFEILTDLGNNGTFYYPKEGLIATALLINDLANIPKASVEDRNKIFDLRNNPIQQSQEKGPKGILDFIYEIKIK